MEQKAGSQKPPLLVGIDLGTTYSVVALMNPEAGQKEYLEHPSGGYRWPSTLNVSKEGERTACLMQVHHLSRLVWVFADESSLCAAIGP